MVESDSSAVDTTVYVYNTDNQLLNYSVNGIDTVSLTYDDNGNQILKFLTKTRLFFKKIRRTLISITYKIS
jgi:hypothetical protein